MPSWAVVDVIRTTFAPDAWLVDAKPTPVTVATRVTASTAARLVLLSLGTIGLLLRPCDGWNEFDATQGRARWHRGQA